MRGYVNKVILLGNLGADPELKHIQSGRAICKLRIATNERRDDEERTEWHNVIVWGKQAELCHKHLRRGRQVYVEGKIQTHVWQDRDGNDRRSTEIQASQVTFLESSGEVEIDKVDDDIPF